MNKAELINSIAEKTGHTQLDTLKTLDALLETIEATVAGGDKGNRSVTPDINRMLEGGFKGTMERSKT